MDNVKDLLSRPLRLDKFDESRTFIVRKNVRVSGHDFVPGEQFDKALVTVRRLRQMYEQRIVIMADEELVKTLARRRRPVFSNLPIEALRDWLRQHGVIARHNQNHAALVQRAEREYDKRQQSEAVA